MLSGGDTITCTVTATDGFGGVTTLSEDFGIGNSAPQITSLAITPTDPVATDTLTCTGSSEDVDGDSLTESHIWENQNTGITLGTSSTITLSSLTASPGDTLSCTYSIDDGTSSVSQTEYTTIANQDPVISTVGISPSVFYNDAEITCIPAITELDQESYTTSYSWSNDTQGSLLGSGDTLQLSDVTAIPGDEIACTVTVEDASGGITSSSSAIAVDNRAPSMDSVSLDQSTLSLGDSVTCSATASDDDNESLSMSYVWSNTTQSMEIGNTATITIDSSMATGGDVISCTATATDAVGEEASDSAEIALESTAPFFTTDASISATGNITTSAFLNCSAIADDPDGGNVVLSYEWSNGSSTIGTSSSITLTPTLVRHRCRDLYRNGNGQCRQTIRSDSVVVETVRPKWDHRLAHRARYHRQCLTCAASPTDADGESLTTAYAWTNGTSTIGTGTTITLTPSLAQPGESVSCTVTTTDGYGGSNSDSASVTVENTDPVISSVSITPDPAYNDDMLTCTNSASDADNQTLTYSTWTTHHGATLGTDETLSLSSATHPKETASPARSPSVIRLATVLPTRRASHLGNRAPVPQPLPCLLIDYIDSSITCAASGSTDQDGDGVSYTYVWTQNSNPRIEIGDQLNDFLTAGDVITRSHPPTAPLPTTNISEHYHQQPKPDRGFGCVGAKHTLHE